MERYDFKTQRLYVNHALKEGGTVEADRSQANYLLNVLRLKEGANVLLFNGMDGEWLAKIQPSGRKACILKLVRRTRPQPAAYSLRYCFAPLKQARLDYMIQKAVEMGAGILQPVLTHHTQISKLNTERMRANALEAAEQCGILSIPKCEEPMKLALLLDHWDEGQTLIFADESADGKNPLQTLADLRGQSSLSILIGPEGGFSEEERAMLLKRPFVRAISLGPRILRADTAAVAALAAVQASCGDW